MQLRKLFVIGAAVAALGVAAGAAFAQTASQKALIDAAKGQGVVGEQADGFLGFRTPSSDAELTAEAGTSADVAGARMFEGQLLPRISSGQWYRNAQGQWVQR